MKKSLKIPKGSETNRKTGEGQTIHWQKEKGQKTAQKTQDRAAQTPLNTGDELSCSGNVSAVPIVILLLQIR